MNDRTRTVLGALSIGAPLEEALKQIGASDVASAKLSPRAVSTLLAVCPAEARQRCAEWMLSALRPRASGPRAATHPTGLVFGALITMVMSGLIGQFVTPVFQEMAGAEAVAWDGTAVTALAGAAMLLGVLGIAMASRGLSARALVEVGFLGVVTLDRDLLLRSGLPIPRRLGKPAGLDALFGWLGAASVAGVSAEQLVKRIPTPALGQASAQRLWSAARAKPDLMAAVQAWAEKEPPAVRNVAVRLEGEDALVTLARVRRVALTVDRTNHAGAVVSAVGFGLLVAAVFLAVHPIMATVARLGEVMG